MGINFLVNRWSNSGYLLRTSSVIYMAPVAIWGVCTIESIFRCVLRALHTAVSGDNDSRSYRWTQTQIHASDAFGVGLLTLVSAVPIIGTYKSYRALFDMIINHVSNTWELRELQQRANVHAADTLYKELTAWEPDIDKLIADAVETAAPTPAQIENTNDNLQATLIGRSVIFTGLFHLIDGCCRALKIIALRVGRLISALFAGHMLRGIIRGALVIKDGIKQEILYACNLVDQPNRANTPEGAVPDLYYDAVYLLLEEFTTPESREKARLVFAKVSLYRQYATSNSLARLSTNGPLPAGAPNDYFHTLRELPAACAHYSKLKARGQDGDLNSILKYFRPAFLYVENFDANCTTRMTSEAKQELLFGISTQLPNLCEINLDMNGIDPRWQMLIAVRLAKCSSQLRSVTLANADPRTATLMRKYTSFFCTVTVL